MTESEMPQALFDRPDSGRQGRSVAVAREGMVAASHPFAVQTGLDLLRDGANAFDAAIAANAMLGVVEPMSCGIGGDLFAICWDATSRSLLGLNASGRSPQAATRDFFVGKGLDEIPTYGPLSWSVPGCVDGWETLRARLGSRPLAELLEPSIRVARDGFPVAEIIAHHWQGAASSLAEWPDSARVYLDDDKAPALGDIVRNPELADSYARIAEGGTDAFYRGRISEEIVRFSRANGGLLDAADFAVHTSEWVSPVQTSYRGYDVWQLPPSGQGIAVLQMLNVLEQFDVSGFGLQSADLTHLLVEAKKLAYADRATWYADPAFADVPTEELIRKEYARSQAARINMQRAAVDVPAGDPKLGQGDTVYLTVVDRDRNCCSLIQSIYHGFGSQVVPGRVGFCLQNRGNSFALDPLHRNTLEPGKRPFHTIIPGFVTKDGAPWFCFGVMGGDMQPQGQVQVLVNMIDFGMHPQAAGDAARVQHFGSQTPTGRPMDSDGGYVALEMGLRAKVAQALEQRGHRIADAPGSFGGYQGIQIDHARGVLLGGTESRKDGLALGY